MKDVTHRGFVVSIAREGRLFAWSATMTYPNDECSPASTSPAWTPWGARSDAYDIIDNYLLPGLEAHRKTVEP